MQRYDLAQSILIPCVMQILEECLEPRLVEPARPVTQAHFDNTRIPVYFVI